MEEIIEKLLELNFDDPALQHTSVVLNQANVNSVTFRFMIYQGADEIQYSAFSRAEMVFRKKDGTNVAEDGEINGEGIFYRLNTHIFDVPGMVTGYIGLFAGDTLSATLHYDFKIVSDLFNVSRMNQFYVGVIEKITAELRITADEAKEIIAQILKDVDITADEAKEIIAQMLKDVDITADEAKEIIAQMLGDAKAILDSLSTDLFVTFAYLYQYRADGGYFTDSSAAAEPGTDYVTHLYLRYYTFDGGYFTPYDEVLIHDVTMHTHETMIVDGSVVEIADGAVRTLEEHITDEKAHQNLIIDGSYSKGEDITVWP